MSAGGRLDPPRRAPGAADGVAGFASSLFASAAFTAAGVASAAAASAAAGAMLFVSAVKSLDFAGGRTSGRRLAGGPFASVALDVRLGTGGATAAVPRATGEGIERCVGLVGCVVFDGRLTGGFFFGSFVARGGAIAARDAAMVALLGDGAFADAGATGELLGATSGRTAGIRVVESMRVGGTSSPSSASE